MDFLSEYASDSSENEETSYINEKPNATVIETKTYTLEISEEKIQERDTPNTVNSQTLVQDKPCNFFGLDSEDSDTDENTSVKTVNKEEIKPQAIRVGDMSVTMEIPNSSFWSDTVGMDLQALQEERYSREKNQSDSLTVWRCKSVSSKRIIGENIGSKSDSSENKRMKFGHTPSAIQNKPNPNQSNPSTMQPARKLYFIHQKITPLLHKGNQHSKKPKTVEWNQTVHVSVVNRVQWCCPSYSHLLVTCSMDSNLRVWNVWSKLDPCVKVLTTHKKAVRDVVWSRNGKDLLSASYDRTAAVTDVEKGVALCQLEHSSHVLCAKYHPVNPHLCLTGEFNQIQAWDTRTPVVPIRTFSYKDNIGQVQDLLFNEDGSQFFCSTDLVSRDSADRNLMAWDFGSGITLSNQIYQERYTVMRLQRHPVEGQFLAQSQAGYIAIFSLTRPYKMCRHKRFEGHKVLGCTIGFDISPDGQVVYSGSSDGKIYCYDYQTGKVQDKLQTGMDIVRDISCHPVLPSTLVACGNDGMLQVWK